MVLRCQCCFLETETGKQAPTPSRQALDSQHVDNVFKFLGSEVLEVGTCPLAMWVCSLVKFRAQMLLIHARIAPCPCNFQSPQTTINPAGFSHELPARQRLLEWVVLAFLPVPLSKMSGKWMRETTNQKHMDTQFALHGCAIFILLTCNHWFNSWNGTPPKFNFIGKMMTNQWV